MSRPWQHFKDFWASHRLLGKDGTLPHLVRADGLLQQLIASKKVPGMAVTVLQHGKPILEKGYGWADRANKVPVLPQYSRFRIASVSKPIASVALAHMVAEGILDMDASIYEYVPYFPQKKYDITLRQLASHTAGIRGYRGKEYALDGPRTIKEGVAVFREDPLLFEPGTEYLYNSYDWCLLSLAMQEASGVPFETYVNQKVLKPLGMEHTVPELKGQRVDHQAAFYTRRASCGFREAVTVDNFFKLAGGGFLSTASDVARFGQAVLEGHPSLPSNMPQFITAQKVQGKSTYYGLGWQVSQDTKGRSFYGHVGNGVGGYANFFVYPEQQMVFAILTNCTDPKVQPELDRVVDELLTASVL